MSQNTSSAVMQQRHEAHDSLEDFPTPPWAGRALCERVLGMNEGESNSASLWEPACNRGYLFDGVEGYFGEDVLCTDIHNYGWSGQNKTCDFLIPYPNERDWDWVITNPPFRLAEQFIQRALNLTTQGVAMIVRSAFLESSSRYNSLFKTNPPSTVAQFVERVPMVKGRYDPKASTATAYAWLVWDKTAKRGETKFVWIPPCRKELERKSDFRKAAQFGKVAA